jgi:hypothetical protein
MKIEEHARATSQRLHEAEHHVLGNVCEGRRTTRTSLPCSLGEIYERLREAKCVDHHLQPTALGRAVHRLGTQEPTP